MIGWLFLAGFGAIVAYPFLIEALRPRMNATRRRAAPGEFTKLSKGITHYKWLGAKEGPIVVCVHGLTTPSFVWGALAEGLGKMGCRVLVYDLYGRGFSDRPRGSQDSAFFITQLEELLADQGVGEGFTLIGYSMGGAIGAAYADKHRAKLKRLVLLAPAGLDHDLGPIADIAIKYNWFGRWMMLGFYLKSLRRATEAERGLPSAVTNIVDLQIAETRLKGMAPAVLASLRGILDEDLAEVHRALEKSDLPVLAIWGETDEVIPLSCRDHLAEWNPSAEQVVIEGAGHTLTYTHTPAVLDALRPHLAQ